MSFKQRFNDNWSFSKQNIGTSITDMKKPEIKWQLVDIPHDWLIYDSNNLYETCEGWYQKDFFYSKKSSLSSLNDYFIENNLNTIYDNKLINEVNCLTRLRFDGVYMDSTVYVNDIEVMNWKYGYSTFEVDITKYLVEGINNIKVQVRHQSPNSRWYSGAGIYRFVWLKTSFPTHFASDGIYISSKRIKDNNSTNFNKNNSVWELTVASEIVFDNSTNSDTFLIKYDILDMNGNKVTSFINNKISVVNEPMEYVKSKCENTKMLGHSSIYSNSTYKSVVCYDNKYDSTIMISNPILWSLDNPYLYTLNATLIKNNAVVDMESCTFGFREVVLSPDFGLYLNGKHTKLNGVCLHHDLGALGSAFNKAALRRQFNILKEMGVNALRTSHNMPAVEFLDLADEMGFLVIDEAFDMWEKPKTEYDYARFFKEWSKKDVSSWIRRDRNHPCIFLWSIGNEIYDTHADSHGEDITRYLMEQVYIHDYKRNALVTLGSNYMSWENARNCADIVKIAGYNYGEKLYESQHREHPDWIIYGSETYSLVQSRGIYHFPLEKSILSDDDCQCSSLGNSATSWGAKDLEYCILAEQNTPFSLGQFLWTGFDYIGEPTPYHTKNSYFGLVDTAGFKKDAFYFYKSCWTDYKVSPFVHIFPYWDFNEGQLIDVRVVSNAPKVELFLDDKSQGLQLLDHKTTTDYSINNYKANNLTENNFKSRNNNGTTEYYEAPKNNFGSKNDNIATKCYEAPKNNFALKDDNIATKCYEASKNNFGSKDDNTATKSCKLIADYQIKYKKGILTAIAYDESNNIVAKTRQASFYDSASIDLSADKTSFYADSEDLIFVTISMKDKNGNPVENASNRVKVNVTGAGRLVGLDNGDSTDYDSYKGTSRRLFSGKLLAIIQSTLDVGNVTVTVSSVGLEAETIILKSLPCKPPADATCLIHNSESEQNDEIPIRKIEIISPNGQNLNKTVTRLPVYAKIYPKNASYKNIEWSVTDDAGVESKLAKIIEPITTNNSASNCMHNKDNSDLVYTKNQATNSLVSNCMHNKNNNDIDYSEFSSAIILQAISDGNFRLRCTNKVLSDKGGYNPKTNLSLDKYDKNSQIDLLMNNADSKNIRIISQLEFSVTGLGIAYKNPYDFISGSLYSSYIGELTNGNERGVATSRDGKTIITYDNLDFGGFGADEITIPIFELESKPTKITFFEGIPDTSNVINLGTFIYDKPSKWNVYQSETFHLNKRLKGVTCISIDVEHKIHIKGFSFTKTEKAYARLNALDADSIYGDTFTKNVSLNSLESIGNNVSLVYEQMDFKDKGFTKLIICGHSPIDKNTIHVRFHGENGDVNQLAEFEYSDSYVEREFNFETIKGMQTVTFIFLPGSNFDFKYFEFK